MRYSLMLEMITISCKNVHNNKLHVQQAIKSPEDSLGQTLSGNPLQGTKDLD